MARPDVDLVDRALVAEVDADRLHEAQRAADLVRDHLVAPPLERARDELLVPRVHLREVGEAALGERAQEVERRDGLVVGLHHPLRIGHAGLGVGSSEWTACPRNDGSSTPSTTSVDAVRGFANWPAIRPTFTTGSVAPYVSTADICRSTFSFSRIATAETSRNDSAQSPAWSRNARPSATSPSARAALRASPAKTSGGSSRSRSRTASTAAASGQSGCCSAGNAAPRGRAPGLRYGHRLESSVRPF